MRPSQCPKEATGHYVLLERHCVVEHGRAPRCGSQFSLARSREAGIPDPGRAEYLAAALAAALAPSGSVFLGSKSLIERHGDRWAPSSMDNGDLEVLGMHSSRNFPRNFPQDTKRGLATDRGPFTLLMRGTGCFMPNTAHRLPFGDIR